MAEFNFPRIERKFIPILEQFIKKSCDQSSIRESEKTLKRKLEDMDNNELLSCFTYNYEHIAKKLDWYDGKMGKSINIYKSIAYLLIDSRNAISHRIVRKGIENKTNSIYQDEWKEEILHYTGMGSTGDQKFDFMQNRTLKESKTNGVNVLLFEVENPKKYTFVGRVKLAGEPYFAKQKDQDGKERKVCRFPLKIVEENFEW